MKISEAPRAAQLTEPTGNQAAPTGRWGRAGAGRRETILLVDDEPAILAITRRTLEDAGYQVLCAGDGQEALAVFAARRDDINLVVTDVAMPAMDGLRFARELLLLGAAVPVIAVTATDSINKDAELATGSVTEFLPKPINRPALLRTVQRRLQTRLPGR